LRHATGMSPRAGFQIHHPNAHTKAKTPSEIGWCFACVCTTKKIGEVLFSYGKYQL